MADMPRVIQIPKENTAWPAIKILHCARQWGTSPKYIYDQCASRKREKVVLIVLGEEFPESECDLDLKEGNFNPQWREKEGHPGCGKMKKDLEESMWPRNLGFLVCNNYWLKQVVKSVLTIACRKRGHASWGKHHPPKNRWKKKREKMHDEDRTSGGSDLLLIQTLWYVSFCSDDTYHRLPCHLSFMFLSLLLCWIVIQFTQEQQWDRAEIAKDL